jgi:hypothetical protein
MTELAVGGEDVVSADELLAAIVGEIVRVGPVSGDATECPK